LTVPSHTDRRPPRQAATGKARGDAPRFAGRFGESYLRRFPQARLLEDS